MEPPIQEAYGVYYTITKWDYYLQGSDIIMLQLSQVLAEVP